jgi:hypothetical protein
MEPASPSSGVDRGSKGTRMSRRLILLAGVFVLLLVGTGVVALTQGGNESSLNPIAQAAARTQDSSGGRTSFYGTITGQGLHHPIEISGRGLFNGTTNRSRLSMAMTAPAPVGRIEMEGVGSASHFYYRSDAFKSVLPEGDEWVGLDLSLGSPSETGAIASASPTGQLGMLRAVSDRFEKLGEKRVRGVETTGYRSAVDPDRYAEYLRGKGAPKAAEEYEQVSETVPEAIEIETWIDGKGLVRQTTVKSNGHDPHSGDETSMEMTIDFHDFGTSPEIELPDPDTVYDLSPTVRPKLGLDG